MIIGVDGNEADVENRVGVNEYAYQLLTNIYNLQDEWGDKHKFVIYLKNPPRFLPEPTENFQYKILKGGKVWIVTRLMPHLIMTREKPDVFFTPSHYIPPVSFVPRVCSIMDLGYLKFSGQFKKYDYWQLRLWTAWSINISKKIICISNATKNDILNHYPRAKNKVEVTWLSYDKTKFNKSIDKKDVAKVVKKYKLPQNYILFLSTLKPSKNVEGLIEAWSKISDKYTNTKLVVAGKKGWLYNEIFEKVKKLELEDRVLFTGFVGEADKPGLIAGAKLFVLPSFWEGFGLDVVSSFAVGTPALVSNRGSLPEVSGNAARIVSPDSIDEIASGMDKILSDKNYREKLIKRGFDRAEDFSWEETARKTIKILESID